MKHSKKLLALLLTLIMAVGVMTVASNAAGSIASGTGWSASADLDYCDETHTSAGDFVAAHNSQHTHDGTYDDIYGYFYSNPTTITISDDSGAQGGVHYIGEGYGHCTYYSTTTYATMNYNLTGGTLVIDNGSNYTSYVTGPANGTGKLLVLSGKVYVNGTFGNIATGEGATVILDGDTTVNGTSVSYYGTTYSKANITGDTWFHDCSGNSIYDRDVPAGLTVSGGDVTIASGSPMLQYLKVTGGKVDLNGVDIENIYRSCGYSSAHTLTAGGIGLEVTGGKVTSTATGGTRTIVGKAYGIKQTGGTIELTGYTIKDTLEIGDDNYAGGAIYVATNTSMTLTNCDIETVGAKTGTGSTPYATLNADMSTIVVNGGTVNITGNGSNYIKGSDNWFDDNDSIGSDPHQYNTALEVNGGTVTVTNMKIDSASGSGSTTIPVTVKDATVTLNGTTVVGGNVCPTTAIEVTNSTSKTATLTLGGTVNSSDSSVVVNASGTGIDASGSNVTIDIDAGTTIKGSGDNGRVNTGIVANEIKEIDIDGGTINAVSYGINATSVPKFSVENATIDVSNSGYAYGISATRCGATKGEIKNSTITVESTNNDAYGVFLNDSTMQVETDNSTNTTTISATANAQNHVAYGVKATNGSEFYMWEGTTINATHKATNGSDTTKAYGIYNDASTVTVNDGAINADVNAGTQKSVNVYGIYNTNVNASTIGVEVNGGTITVGQHFGTNDVMSDVAYGLYNDCAGKLRMCGGTVNVYSDGSADSYGAYVYNGDIEMLGGTIKLMNEHEDGVFVKNGQFIMGAYQQSTLPTEPGTACTDTDPGYPYIVYEGTTNNKVFGIDATGGTTYLYAGKVDVSKKSGFHAVHVDGGQVVIWLNENVNPAYDTDDTTMFTAVANASEGAAFYAKTGNWQIRGTGALFEAKVAFYANAGTVGNFSGGTFKGEMQYTAGNIDTLFAVNHYLRNDGAAGKAGTPTDGTALVSAAAKTIDNANYYTVTDAEWELRYALEQNNSINTYTMPVDIVLNDNTGIWGAMANGGGVDVPTGTFVLNMNDKTLSTSAKGGTFANAESYVIRVGTVSNNGGNLTINGTTVTAGVPTSTIKSGQKIATGSSSKDEAVIWNWGTLTLNKVTVDGTEPDVFRGVYSNKSATITECVIKTDVANGIGVLVHNGTADITDSAISGDHAAIETEGGTTTNIKNTAGKTTTVSAVGSHFAIDADRGTVNLQGTDDAGVVVNGLTCSMLSNAIINVYHATFNGDVDAYYGTINIYGGSFPKGGSPSYYKLNAGVNSTDTGTINIKKDSAEGAVAPTIARDVIVKEAAKLNVHDGSTIQGTVSTAGTTYVYDGTFENTFTVTAGTTTIDDGTFNDDVTFTGGETTIYGGSFKTGEPFTVNGGTVDVETKTGTTVVPTIDRNITVSGGTLTVTNGTVNGIVEKTSGTTGVVVLKEETKYLGLKSNDNLSNMMHTDVQYIVDQNENQSIANVYEKGISGFLNVNTEVTKTQTNGYLVLKAGLVENLQLVDNNSITNNSGAVTGYTAPTSTVGQGAVTLDRIALKNSTSAYTFQLSPSNLTVGAGVGDSYRQVKWVVTATSGGNATKVTLTGANGTEVTGVTGQPNAYTTYGAQAVVTVNVAKDAPCGTYKVTATSVDGAKTDFFTITVAPTNLDSAIITLDHTYFQYDTTEKTTNIQTFTVQVNGKTYNVTTDEYTISGNTQTAKNGYNALVAPVTGETTMTAANRQLPWEIREAQATLVIHNKTGVTKDSTLTADDITALATVTGIAAADDSGITKAFTYRVNGTNYTTAADAANALGAINETKTIQITVALSGGNAANYGISNNNATATISLASSGPIGGGGGGAAPAPKTYTVTCGTGVKADKTSVASGAKVTLTVSEGYENIVVKDAKGNAVTVSGNTFEMPDSDVTVSVSKKGVATTYDKCDKGEVCVLKAFNDLDAWRWYHDGIHYCLDNGVMNGLGNGEFAPTASTTRGMIFTILARLDGVTITSTGNEWYTDGQAWSVKAGVSDGTDPTGNITREQLAAMLYRYAKLKGYDVSVGEDTNILSYDDAFSVSEYAVGAMQWAVGAGIINGDNNNLKPTTGATRVEVATMLMRFCETVVK